MMLSHLAFAELCLREAYILAFCSNFVVGLATLSFELLGAKKKCVFQYYID